MGSTYRQRPSRFDLIQILKTKKSSFEVVGRETQSAFSDIILLSKSVSDPEDSLLELFNKSTRSDGWFDRFFRLRLFLRAR